jgi:hypothetical protein
LISRTGGAAKGVAATVRFHEERAPVKSWREQQFLADAEHEPPWRAARRACGRDAKHKRRDEEIQDYRRLLFADSVNGRFWTFEKRISEIRQ